MTRLFRILDAALGGLVRWIILPVTGVIPFLVRTGLLFGGFVVLWAVFLAALVLEPTALDTCWAWLTSLHLLAQAVLWLLLLPLTGALWAWSTDWPLVVRVAIVLGIAAWNLLAFRPQRTAGPNPAAAPAPTAAAEA